MITNCSGVGEKMKAAILREAHLRMQIEDVVISKPEPQEVLIRLAAAGVCHSDLHIIDGDLPHPFPVILGHEAAGIVEQVGANVATVRPGDHVIICLTFPCGHCEQCDDGHGNRCDNPAALRTAGSPSRLTIGNEAVAQFLKVGAFAEQMLVHESGCVVIRKDMPLDRACLISCGVATGFGAVARSAAVRPGESVAIIGCGGVGLATINGAEVAGAGRIIAIDRLPMKLEMAKEFGATDTVDASAGGAVDAVMALTGGKGVDHAIEAIGRKETIEAAFNMLAKGGLATVLGAAKRETLIELPALSLLREKRLQGSMMGGVRTSIDIPRYVDLYMQGKLKLDELISRRRPLSEINEAFDDLRNGEIARSVIMFGA
jgi:S-(hydroxymethyl)glutathione dehydrogenase/alcohol dehydrogenase